MHVYNSIKNFLYISVVYETYSKGIFYIDTFVISLKAFRKKKCDESPVCKSWRK